MKTSAITHSKRSGFITLLSAVVICGFVLGLMGIMYRASIRSLEAQRKVQFTIDQSTRQQSFLRAMVTLAPVYAANTMADGTASNFYGNGGLLNEAASIARLGAARSAEDNTGLNFGAYKDGNVGTVSSGFAVTDYVGDAAVQALPSGVGAAVAAGYPAPQFVRAGSTNVVSNSKAAPLISSDVTYNAASTSGDDRDFDLITYPNIHFGYKNPGDPFIARQNWWKVDLHARATDLAAVGLGGGAAGLSQNEYVLSIYEIPSQLAISASGFANIGNIAGQAFDTGNAGNITIQGTVYAKKAELTHGTIEGLSTNQGATINGGTVGDGTAQTQSKESYEAANNRYYPISKASDYARSLFLPINPGFNIFDRFATSAANSAVTGKLSRETWYEYACPSHQAKMKLDILEVVGGASNDNTPLAMRFSYNGYSQVIYKTTSTVYNTGIIWPDGNDGVFPFVSEESSSGTPGVAIYLDRLAAWLQTADGGGLSAADVAQNHSLVVNTDYITNSTLVKPTATVSPMVVILRGCDDLTVFTEGFSLVTNYSLQILESLNNTPYSGTTYPPLSVFAPSISYGIGDVFRSVNVVGSMHSVNTGTNAVEVLAVKDTSGNAAANQTFAQLKPINTIEELPPINLMNWLVLVQKKE